MSDVTTDAPADTSEPDAPPVDPPETGEPDYKAEADKWKHQARENEKRAKANADAAKELEKFRKASMTEVEKAVAEAEARGRLSAVTEFGSKLAEARLTAALTGIVPDPAVVLEDLNLSKFITDTGEVDDKAVDGLREKYAAMTAAAAKSAANPRVPSGPRGDGGDVPITSRTQLQKMTPEQIVAAHRAGRIQIAGE